jgi:hypothetical protein
MLEFNIKLRNDVKKLSLSKLKSNSLKLKFKVKGLYKDNKFRGEVYLVIKLENGKLKIVDVSIYDLNVIDCKSSSEYIFNNVYTMTAYDVINDENVTKKVYNYLKNLINNIQITTDKNLITSIVFDLRDSKIRKLNIKGYVRKY